MFIAFSCSRSNRSPECETALQELDNTLDHLADFEHTKSERTNALWKEYAAKTDYNSKYDICKDLYREYSRYDLDSALTCAHLMADIANKTGKIELISDAALDLADRYRVSGMFDGAQEVMAGIDTTKLSIDLLNKYNITRYSIYHGLAATDKDSVRIKNHLEKEAYYTNLCKDSMQKDELDFLKLKAEACINDAHPEEARQLLLSYLQDREVSIREKAEVEYWIAKTYAAENDVDNQILHYAISANYDKQTPVRASRSLVKLAHILYDSGDIDRAYSYMTTAYNDATKADARVALEEINKLLSDVIQQYNHLAQRRSQMVYLLLIFAIAGIAVLILLLATVNRDRKKIRRIQKQIENNNEYLKEANKIKTAYIGKYLSMFSEHIDSLEQYRSQLRVTAKTKDVDEIQKALRSNDFIDMERKVLYSEFDSTFLGIYPDFIPLLNGLLKEDCQVGQDLPPNTLTNELRIFALIKLGVTESSVIARFLKKSPSTIYNYRVKMRNAALKDRDNFENQVFKLGYLPE